MTNSKLIFNGRMTFLSNFSTGYCHEVDTSCHIKRTDEFWACHTHTHTHTHYVLPTESRKLRSVLVWLTRIVKSRLLWLIGRIWVLIADSHHPKSKSDMRPTALTDGKQSCSCFTSSFKVPMTTFFVTDDNGMWLNVDHSCQQTAHCVCIWSTDPGI
jgi:hypothetical protein